MSDIDTMSAAYIEAIYFTDTGDTDQPPKDAELTPFDKAKSYLDCRQFYWGVTEDLQISPDELDWRQVGIDLWLTRNGHGVSFQDREEVYGEERARIFSAMAKAMGNHDAFFEEQTT